MIVTARASANADKTSHWKLEKMKDTSRFLDIMQGQSLELVGLR